MSKIAKIRESDFPELLGAVKRAELALNNANAALQAAMIDAYPLKVGDRLTSTEGNVAEVYKVYVKYCEIRVAAKLLKNNGEVGNRDAPLWREIWGGYLT